MKVTLRGVFFDSGRSLLVDDFCRALVKNLVLVANADLHEGVLDRLDLALALFVGGGHCCGNVLGLVINWLALLRLLISGSTLDQMLGLSIEIAGGLVLVATVTADPTLEVVVLALTADPAAIGEVEVVLLAVL